MDAAAGTSTVAAEHPLLGKFVLSCEGDVPLLFTENETNHQRLFGHKNESPHVKDGINDCVVQGNQEAVNPEKTGTKVAAHYKMDLAAGQSKVVHVRLSKTFPEQKSKTFGKQFDEVFAERLREADEFYKSVTPPSVSTDAAKVMRQALAGMLWSKQFFFFDGDNWLDEHNSNPLHTGYKNSRNSEWFHMLNQDIISMPDKWEYPWYAAWDLAFHTLPLSIVDPDFSKQQMGLMLEATYQHPNGQMPAYEWNFSDVNPPVHAFATLFLHRTEQALRGETDIEFLKLAFNKLALNFTWWVNRKDRFGKNVFEGGFLGLDNIGVFDRSAALPTGGYLEQADGTAWMALFSQNMLELAFELGSHDATYEPMILKFAQLFVYIARGMNQPGQEGMWDEEDGFYYDLLRLPDGSAQRLKVRSMVGLLPLCATTVTEKRQRERMPAVVARFWKQLQRTPELLETIHATGPGNFGVAERGIIALVNQERLPRIFTRDEQGRRPVYGGTEKFQSDPHWRDYILFYEYFHGDNGAGLGASHQTGWTGLVAKLIQLYGIVDPKQMLEVGREAAFV